MFCKRVSILSASVSVHHWGCITPNIISMACTITKGNPWKNNPAYKIQNTPVVLGAGVPVTSSSTCMELHNCVINFAKFLHSAVSMAT